MKIHIVGDLLKEDGTKQRYVSVNQVDYFGRVIEITKDYKLIVDGEILVPELEKPVALECYSYTSYQEPDDTKHDESDMPEELNMSIHLEAYNRKSSH